MRVPTYQNQASAQVVQQPKAGGASVYPELQRFGVAVQDIGSLLAQRQMIRDEADASNAFNAYAEEAITFKTELEKRKGVEARSISDDYKKWHIDSVSRIKEKYLHNPESQTIFSGVANKHYMSKIGSLAQYQAKEEQEYNKSILERDLQNIDAEVTDDPYATDGDTLAVENRIAQYHRKAALLLGGAYTQDVAGDMEAKIKTSALTSMVVKDPSRIGPVLDKWKVDIGANAYAQFTKSAKAEIIKKQVDTVYDTARMMDIVDAEEYINKSGLPKDERRQLLSDVRTDFDRKLKETEKQQKEITDQNNLDVLEAYFNNTLNEKDLDTLAEGQQVDRGIYQYVKNQIREDRKIKENNPEIVAEITRRIELKDYNSAKAMLSDALQKGQIKGETFITMTKALASDSMGDAIGYINRAMQPSELEFDPYKRQKHADAIVDLANRVANNADPIESAKDIVRLNKTTTATFLSRYRRPRFLKGDKENLIHMADAEFSTVNAYKSGVLSESEYKAEIELIEKIKEANAETMRSKESEDSANEALKGLKIGR